MEPKPWQPWHSSRKSWKRGYAWLWWEASSGCSSSEDQPAWRKILRAVYPCLSDVTNIQYMWPCGCLKLHQIPSVHLTTQYTDFLVGFRRFNTSSRAYCCYYHLGYGIFFDRDCMNKLLAFSLEFGSALISKNPLVRKEQHQFPPPCRKDR